MKVAVVSHRDIAHELGHLEPWLDRIATSGLVRIYREDGLTSSALTGADLLVVLGSPGSVATGHCLPPAQGEIELVREWTSSRRPYLGICFGAQVLACALGGSVHRMQSTYRDYCRLPVAATAPKALTGPWAIWHADAITSPAAATTHARLDHADIAFQHDRAWGLQPHIEVTSESLARMLAALGVDPADCAPIIERMTLDEASPEPPKVRVAELLEKFEASAFG